MAKESVVSTLSILFGSTAALTAVINTAGAAALLIFCLLYTPCVAAIASIKRELGGKWAIGVVIFQCVIAWVAAFMELYVCFKTKTSGNRKTASRSFLLQIFFQGIQISCP